MTGSIQVQNVSKGNRKFQTISNVSFTIEAGSITAIIGGLGAGKTTLLHLLAGFNHVSAGTILYPENEPLKIGAFTNQTAFINCLSVRDHIEMKTRACGIKKPGFVEDYLVRFGLKHCEKVLLKRLSRELKNRLGVALAMIGGPDLLLLDEPFDNITDQEVFALKQLILDYQAHTNATVVITAKTEHFLGDFVTHFVNLSDGEVHRPVYQQTYQERSLPTYIKLVCEPLADAKSVLQEMGIYSYQTKSDYMLYIFERFDDVELIQKTLEEKNIHITEISLQSDEATGKRG